MVTSQKTRDLFHHYSTIEDLPQNPTQQSEFFRYVVGNIRNPLAQNRALNLIRKLPSEYTAKYLVMALNSKSIDNHHFINLLRESGPCEYTVKPLVGLLDHPCKQSSITDLLIEYGPSQCTAKPLVGALRQPEKVIPITNILSQYGAHESVVRNLVGVLSEESHHLIAKEILKLFGPTNTTCNYLTIVLGDSYKQEIVTEIFLEYGYCHVVEKYLTQEKNNGRSSIIASKILDQLKLKKSSAQYGL